MKTVVVVSLDNIDNAGDEVIGDIAQHLIEDISDGVVVKRMGFAPSFSYLIKKRYILSSLIAIPMLAFVKLLKDGIIKYRIKNVAYKIRYGKYFKDSLKKSDAVICAIGGLKFSTQNFSYLYAILCHTAQIHGIPVMFCGQSIEKYDKKDWRCRQLCHAISYPVVKMITTRDGNLGISRLKKYVKRDIYISDVGDLALWIPEYYNVKKRNSGMIGIGLVRGDIYQDYMPESNIDESRLMSIYQDIVLELDKREYKWVFFCNGMVQDYDFGRRLIKRLNLPNDKLLQIPDSASELINVIAGFKAVIGARFHACMISFAIDVPFIGMMWDSKFAGLGKMMDIEEQFVDVENLNGVYMVNLLEAVLEKNEFSERKEQYKMRTRDDLRLFMDNYVRED